MKYCTFAPEHVDSPVQREACYGVKMCEVCDVLQFCKESALAKLYVNSTFQVTKSDRRVGSVAVKSMSQVIRVMEVLCLNGTSVEVAVSESLEDAKVKVAKALGAFPEAIWISCGGQILRGETLENCLVKLELSLDSLESLPLFGVVDQKRMELGRHLQMFEHQLEACQEKLLQNEKLSAKLEQKKKDLSVNFVCCYPEILRIERQLKEGNLSLQTEKALVSQLAKLRRLDKIESQLSRSVEEVFMLRCRLDQDITKARSLLKAALTNDAQDVTKDLTKDLMKDSQVEELLKEFDELARARHPGRSPLSDDTYSDISWLDSVSEMEFLDEERRFSDEMTFGKVDELKASYPRLLRRELWKNSKGSWKYVVPKVPKGHNSRRDQKKDRKDRQGKPCRPDLRGGYKGTRDVRNQLEEYLDQFVS